MKKSTILGLLLLPCIFIIIALQGQQSIQTHHEELKKLDWLVGQWLDQDKDDDLDINLSYSWDEHKNFLTNKFTILSKNKKEMDGKQIIGWDPSTKEIRSWVFDSDGGFGHGIWRQKGDLWIVESAYTLPNGQKASSINIYKKMDDNNYSYESTGRSIDGEFLPDIEPVTITRSKK